MSKDSKLEVEQTAVKNLQAGGDITIGPTTQTVNRQEPDFLSWNLNHFKMKNLSRLAIVLSLIVLSLI